MLFDPAKPLPPYPAWKIERQLQTRAALPPRIIPPRYVWIVTSRPDWLTLEHARSAALGAHRLAKSGWHVIVTADDDARAMIVKTCKSYGIECEVVTERRAWTLAHKIVAWGRPDVLRKAVKRRVPIWYDQKAIELPGWQMELPFVWELARAA